MKSLHGCKQTFMNYTITLNQITSNQSITKLQINHSPNHTPNIKRLMMAS